MGGLYLQESQYTIIIHHQRLYKRLSSVSQLDVFQEIFSELNKQGNIIKSRSFICSKAVLRSKRIKMNTSHFETVTNPSQAKGFLGLPCNAALDEVFIFLNTILAVVILAGNSVACAVFLKARHLRRSYMNSYLVSLAISDMFMGALVMPFYSVFCSGCEYSLTAHCWVIRTLKGVTFGANILNLLAISFDRHKALFRPLRYASSMTKERVLTILIAVWGIPLLLTAARNIWQHSDSKDEALYIDRVYSYILNVIFVIIPFFLLLGMNFRILYAIKEQMRRIHVDNSAKMRLHLSVLNQCPTRSNIRKLKGTLACFVVVLVFILCWLPRIFLNFCSMFRGLDLVSPMLIKLSLFFLFLQSSLNPFIYSFYRAEFRQAALRLLRCQKPSVDRIFVFTSRNTLD